MNRKYLTSLVAGVTLLVAPVAASAAETPNLAEPATLEQLVTASSEDGSDADGDGGTESSSETTGTHSSAESTGAEVEGIVAISDTSADSNGEASADALRLGDETVVGGSADGETSDASGEIFDSGETELGRLALAAWEASVGQDTSQSRATLVQLTVIDEETVDAKVFDSYSEATGDGSNSYSEGVRITLGGGAENDGLTIVLLRTESSSDGEASTYLASVNGEKAFTDEQAEGQLCNIDANPLLYVKALCAEADEESGGVNAGVAEVDALDDNLHAQVVTAGAAPGADDEEGADAEDSADAPSDSDDNTTEVQSAANEPLPRTGAPGAIGLLGLMAIGSGELLRRFKR